MIVCECTSVRQNVSSRAQDNDAVFRKLPFPHLPKQNTFKVNFIAPPGRGGRWWSKGLRCIFRCIHLLLYCCSVADWCDPNTLVVLTRNLWSALIQRSFSFWTVPQPAMLCCGRMLGEHNQSATKVLRKKYFSQYSLMYSRLGHHSFSWANHTKS